MRKSTGIVGLLLFLLTMMLLLNRCKKEEYVTVYSEIITVGASGTTSTTASIGGNIVELTTATHSEYGICWDTLANPTVYKNKTLASGTPVVGTFTIQLTGLKPSKTYHAKAFVKDNKKYIYGADKTFSTSSAVLPVVTTAAASGITSRYAYSGGNVTSQGDKPVTAKGVCFDTLASPTVYKSKTMDGWGTGSFTSMLNDLKPSKKYYVRAYAISEFGISYGAEVSFTTSDKAYTFHDDFTNNNNAWYTGTFTYGSASLTGGEYVISYKQEGYMWRTYNNITGFAAMANSEDFEINATLTNLPYALAVAYDEEIGGIVWDCASSNFKYFAIKKVLGSNPVLSTPTYYYYTGSYSGSYTVWKALTTFSGTAANTVSIKKAGSYYYFFINGVQVYKHTYSSLNYDGVGFFAEDGKVKAGYLYIDQMGEKKSDVDMIQMVTGASGKHDYVRSLNR